MKLEDLTGIEKAFAFLFLCFLIATIAVFVAIGVMIVAQILGNIPACG